MSAGTRCLVPFALCLPLLQNLIIQVSDQLLQSCRIWPKSWGFWCFKSELLTPYIESAPSFGARDTKTKFATHLSSLCYCNFLYHKSVYVALDGFSVFELLGIAGNCDIPMPKGQSKNDLQTLKMAIPG